MAVMWRCLQVSTCLAWSGSYRTASYDGQDTWQEWTYIRDRLPRKLLLAWVKDVSRPRGRVFSYGHDLSRELKSIGFNLEDRAMWMGVSPDWIDVAQRRDAWHGLAEPLLVMAEATPSLQSKE